MISTRTHGMLDYIVGALLMVSPWLFGFADGGAEMWIPIVLGGGAIVYSLMTDYEYGIVKVLPMSAHLALDLLSGMVLAASPWVLGFADRVYLPHLIFGLLEIGVVAMTRRAEAMQTTAGSVQ